MAQDLLVREQIDEGAEFIRSFNDAFPVAVACWIQPADTEMPYLYIASDNINDSNMRQAYAEMLARYRRNQWFTPFQIKLIDSSHPIARDAIESRDLYAVESPMKYPGTSIGGLGIEFAYIYPPLTPEIGS